MSNARINRSMQLSHFLIIAILSMLASAFFSGMEAGVLALSRLRLRQYLRSGKRQAAALLNYLDTPEEFLWTTLVGATLFGIVAFASSLKLFLEAFPNARWLSLVLWPVFVIVYYLLGELAPKLLFQRFPNRLCISCHRAFRILSWALWPLVKAVSWLARILTRKTQRSSFFSQIFNDRNQVRMMLKDAAPILTKEEGAIIDRVLSLSEIEASELARPLAKCHRISVERQVSAALDICRETGLNRLPVVGRGPDATNVKGVFDLDYALYQPGLSHDQTVRDWMRRPLFVSGKDSVKDVLGQLQATNSRLAVVRATDHTDLGIVSINDILSIIFGHVDTASQGPLSKL